MKPTAYTEANARRDYFYTSLENKVVTIIGLGGGGEIALKLLQSGITQMNLIDFDTLDAGNLVRHICGSEYIGQNKAEAVKSLLDRYAGITSVDSGISTYTFDIFEQELAFEAIVAKSDVVIAATDTDASRLLIGEAAAKFGKPAIFISMLEMGVGGELMATSLDGPCYSCFLHHQNRKSFITKYHQSVHKGDCASKRDTKSMPGLGIDQGFLCNLAARKALDILLTGTSHHLPSIGTNWIVFSISGIGQILDTPLSSYMLQVARHPECSCHHE